MIGRNKIKLTVVIILAACTTFLYSQPEYFFVNADGFKFKIYTWGDEIYKKSGFTYEKLTDEILLDLKIYDIDQDYNDELLVLSSLTRDDIYGRDLIVYDIEGADNSVYVKEIYRQDFSRLKPWKVDACNLDDDGDTDIFIGVLKDTVFYDEIRKRPFFYSWDGKKLYKKWQGSFFSDWDIIDISFGDYFNLGYDVAAVLEKNNDNCRVGFYNYTGFGFLNIARRGNYKNAVGLTTENDKLYLNSGGFKGISAVDL